MAAVLTAITTLAVALLVLAERRGTSWRRPAKVVASTGFIAVALSVGALDTGYGRAVLVALALSWVGDFLLTFPANRAFLGGLVVFLLGHVAYVAAFAIRGIDPAVLVASVAGLAVVAVLVWRWLAPHVEAGMRIPVGAYIVVISVMVAAAFGTAAFHVDARIVIGAVAFFLSDIAVARNQFVAPGFVNRAWGLPMYYFGQILLALSAGGRA